MSVAPVFSAPPDVRCEVGPLQAWFTDPPGALLQLSAAAPFTRSMAIWVGGVGYDLLNEHFLGADGLTLVFDIRPLTTREPAARTVMMEAGHKYIRRFETVLLVAPLKPPPLYMITLHSAAALLGAFGSEVKIVDTLEEALAYRQLRPESRA